MADKAGKPIPVRPGESTKTITVGGTNFASMNSVEQLQNMMAFAPPTDHITRALLASGKVREIPDPLALQPMHVGNNVGKGLSHFGKGATVRNKAGKKLTIIRASVGHMKKAGVDVHKVADKEGNVWLEREDNLKLLL
jgi:hypothetical protein